MKKIVTGLLAAMLLAGCGSTANSGTTTTQTSEPEAKDDVVEVVAKKELPAPVDTTLTYKPSEDAAETQCTEDAYVSGCAAITNTNLREYL